MTLFDAMLISYVVWLLSGFTMLGEDIVETVKVKGVSDERLVPRVFIPAFALFMTLLPFFLVSEFCGMMKRKIRIARAKRQMKRAARK